MKPIVFASILAVVAESIPVAPSNRVGMTTAASAHENDVEIHTEQPKSVVTVDRTSAKSTWVAKYGEKLSPHGKPAVDDTSTRGQWVTSYSNKSPGHGQPAVDETSTRGKWVTSYSNKSPYAHWMPTGPDYLDLSSLGLDGAHTHWISIHDPSSHVSSGIFSTMKRYFKAVFA